jgi:hypothetical protein
MRSKGDACRIWLVLQVDSVGKAVQGMQKIPT